MYSKFGGMCYFVLVSFIGLVPWLQMISQRSIVPVLSLWMVFIFVTGRY